MQKLLAAVMYCTFINMGHCQVIVGHRGASFDAPENTLAAFREAWIQGADGIEADFYFTSDQEIVCIHDRDALRTGGKEIVVAESSLADLRKLEYGSWKSPNFHGEPIPTFAQVAKIVPEDKLFVVELKTGPEIVPLLAKQIRELQLDPKQLLIIAFDSTTIAKAKQLLPEVRAHWLTGYKRDRRTGNWLPTAQEIVATLADCSADGLGTKGERSVVDQEFLRQLKAGGMREFHVWTIDEPADAEYFQQLGAVGITTNRPALIRQALK